MKSCLMQKQINKEVQADQYIWFCKHLILLYICPQGVQVPFVNLLVIIT